MRTAIQLYTLRTLEESLTTMLERIGDTLFDGVEFAGLDDAEPATLARTLTDAGLELAGAHVPIEELEEATDRVFADYAALGCDRLVVPAYPSGAFETEQGVEEAAKRLSAVASKVEAEGFELHYHNHAFEFESLGGESAFERFAARTSDSVRFQIDTGLARYGGVDPAALIDRYADRVSLVHLTDAKVESSNVHHAELGSGDVDLQACTTAAERSDVDWLICEHGTTADPLTTLATCESTLRTLLK